MLVPAVLAPFSVFWVLLASQVCGRVRSLKAWPRQYVQMSCPTLRCNIGPRIRKSSGLRTCKPPECWEDVFAEPSFEGSKHPPSSDCRQRKGTRRCRRVPRHGVSLSLRHRDASKRSRVASRNATKRSRGAAEKHSCAGMELHLVGHLLLHPELGLTSRHRVPVG